MLEQAAALRFASFGPQKASDYVETSWEVLGDM
jgi:hypothetical protein